MELGKAVVIVAGVGCRRGASAPEIEAVVLEALRSAGRGTEELCRLATAEWKSGEPGIREAARRLGLPLMLVPAALLATVTEGVRSRSARVLTLFGIPSVAETAALAGAGPAARLLAPRTSCGPATCALATSEGTRP